MKQVWPRPKGYSVPVELCESKSDRLAFSHPYALGCLIPGAIFAVITLTLGLAGGTSEGGFGVETVGGLGSATLLLFGAADLLKWRREDNIARTGAEAWAEVTDLKAGRTPISYRRPYKLRFRYQDASGAEHQGKTRVIGSSWAKFGGQPVLVRYDPAHPERSAIVWNDLRDERGIPY